MSHFKSNLPIDKWEDSEQEIIIQSIKEHGDTRLAITTAAELLAPRRSEVAVKTQYYELGIKGRFDGIIDTAKFVKREEKRKARAESKKDKTPSPDSIPAKEKFTNQVDIVKETTSDKEPFWKKYVGTTIAPAKTFNPEPFKRKLNKATPGQIITALDLFRSLPASEKIQLLQESSRNVAFEGKFYVQTDFGVLPVQGRFILRGNFEVETV